MEDDYAAASVEKSQWKNKVFHIEPATSLGTNCIKICLPGKQILSERKGRPFLLKKKSLRIDFPGRPIFIQLPPGHCLALCRIGNFSGSTYACNMLSFMVATSNCYLGNNDKSTGSHSVPNGLSQVYLDRGRNYESEMKILFFSLSLMALPVYRVGHPICRKVLKIMFWKFLRLIG